MHYKKNKDLKKEPEKTKLGYIEIIIIVVSIIIFIFSFFAPSIFVKESINGIDFTKTGAIGDTIGGIMNPFIASAGVLLTFLAFYIQFKANKQQRDLFRQELDSNKFENQFYEMLRLHKENVNEIKLNLSTEKTIGGETIIQNREVIGRESFKFLLEEIKIAYYVAKKKFPNDNREKIINMAYSVFFQGVDSFKSRPTETDEDRTLYQFCKDLEYINDGNKNNGKKGNQSEFRQYVSEKSDYQIAKVLNYDIFQGHSAILAHYYRHLYQTVKFIAKQEEGFITYNEKRNYLRILRSQLSNQEQAMLFYNWKSDFGYSWENYENKYFTDYRMIHNLNNDLLINEFKLEYIFNVSASNYRKESNRKIDNLFEFQD
jgi:hypothetical protein